MKKTLGSRRDRCLARFGIFLIMMALITGMVGCSSPSEEQEEEEQEPEIQTWYDLDAIRNHLDGTYLLGEDLDSTTPGYQELASQIANAGKGWEPIGTWDLAFTGTFDGGGHSIAGLCISRPDEDDVGLFGYVEEGVIKNIGLVEAEITGGNQTGALVGYNWGGTVESDPTRPYSTYSTGSVTGNDKVGGLVGYNWGGIVSLCQSSTDVAHVAGETWRAGGLVGSNWGDVLLCIYRGSVTGDHEVGGLVGLNGDLIPGGMGGRVVSCYGEYTVAGNWFVGGAAGVNLGSLDNIALNFSVNGHPVNGGSLMALNTDTTIDGHSSDTAPQGSYVGGLVGLNKGSVNNCVTVGSVTGNQYIGGLVGYNDPDGVIGSSFAAAAVEGSLDFGGLVGYNDATGTVANSFWDREASDTNTGVGTGDAAGITSKSSQEMKDINTYIEAGWDICAVAPGQSNKACTWNMIPGETYPFLSGKQPVQYNLTISATEGGQVTTPGEGTSTYDEGTVVNLVAEAEEGYEFARWAGDVDTVADINSASTTISINGDYVITANFDPPTYESLDYFPVAEGHGIKYHVTDSFDDTPLNVDVWAVSQYFETGKPDDLDFVFTLVKEGTGGEYYAPNSLGGQTLFPWDGKCQTAFYAGCPSSNQGNFYGDFCILCTFSSGDEWTWVNRHYMAEHIGQQTVNGVDFDDCVKISIDNSLHENEYVRGSGYFILARDVGIVELVFNRTNGTRVSYEYMEHKQFGRHTISGTMREGGMPVEGVIVQISICNWGTRSVTDSNGVFSVQVYGPDIVLRLGYDEDNDDVVDLDDYADYPKEYSVNDIASDIVDLSIEMSTL